MKKTWITILVLAMMMMVIFATGCAEKESPAADTPEQATAFDGVNFKEFSELSEADDAQFRGGADNEESALDYR